MNIEQLLDKIRHNAESEMCATDRHKDTVCWFLFHLLPLNVFILPSLAPQLFSTFLWFIFFTEMLKPDLKSKVGRR